MTSRREFIVQFGLGSAALVASYGMPQGAIAEGTMVAENDPQAVALGYKVDANKADKAKFPKYAAGQQCGNCALYQGNAGGASGGCPLFAGKQVSAKAWCSAWSKKA
jgi:hypothetical protein